FNGIERCSAATAEAEGVERVPRVYEGVHRENPSRGATEVAAAANQRGGKGHDTGTTRAPEAAEVATGNALYWGAGRPSRAVHCLVGPVGDPLIDVAHHVERAPRRLALRPRTRVGRDVGAGDIAVRGPVVRARVRRAGRRPLPLVVAQEPFARQ